MAQFTYKARRRTGEVVEGVLDVADRTVAVMQIEKLGLLPVAVAETLIVDPTLPAWLPEVVLRDLRIGNAKVSLRFWRKADGSSDWEILHRQGSVRVVRQPPPESGAPWTDRAAAVLESIMRS